MRIAPGLAAAVALASLAGMVTVTTLWWPFQSDHGVYAWMADVVLSGGMPYRDAWDVKGPAAMVPALVAQVLFGRNMWGVRIVDQMVLLGAAAMLYRLMVRWIKVPGAVLAACMLITLYLHGGFGSTAQPDGVWGMLLFLSIAPLLRVEQPSRIGLLLAGACIGGLVLLKPIYGAFLLLPVLALRRAPSHQTFARQLAAIGIGFAVPVSAALVWLAVRGGFDAFVDAYIRFNAAKNSGNFVWGFLENLSDGVLAEPEWLVLGAGAVAGFFLLRGRDPRAARVLGTWAAVALILVHVQRPFYYYRTHVLSPPIVVLASYAVAQVVAARGAGRTLAIGVSAAVALAFARLPLRDAARWAWFYPGPGRAESLRSAQRLLTTTAAGERRMIRVVAHQSESGDSVFAYRHPSVYFLAHRPAASRISIQAAIGAGAPEPFAARHLEELGRALMTTRPKVIVLPDTGGTRICLGCFDPLDRLPAAARTLGPHYRLLQRSDGFAMFVRTDSANGLSRH